MNMALVLMAKAFKLNYSTPTNNNQRISSNPRNRQTAQPCMNLGQDNQMLMVGVQNPGIQNVVNQNELIVVLGIANQNVNQTGNGNVIATRAEGNGNGNANNSNQIRCYNCRGLGYYAMNCTAKPRKRDAAFLQTQLLIAQKEEEGIQLQAGEFDFMATAGDLEEIKEVNANCILMANLQQASTLGTQTDKAPVYDSDESAENDCNVISAVSSVEQNRGTIEQHPATIEEKRAKGLTSPEQTATGKGISNPLMAVMVCQKPYGIQLTNVSRVNTPGSDENRLKLYDLMYKNVKVADTMVKDYNSNSKFDISSCVHLGIDIDIPRQYLYSQDLHLAKHKALVYEIESLLKAVVSQDNMSIVQSNSVVDTSNLQTELERMKESQDTPCVSDTLDPLSQKLEDENVSLDFQVVESEDLSNPVTSNSVPITKASNVMKNDNVIASGMFKINPSKTFREDKFMPINQARESVRTNSITVSKSHVITKKDVNSDSNGLSSTGVDNTAKTRRPQPRINTKTDRVPSTSKSSCIKNKEVKVEEHPRNLLLYKNKKHMSSECNNIMIAIWNDKFEVVCAMCKQCLITANHDVCVLKYVTDMNSYGDKHSANVSKTANKRKHKPKGKKPKKVGSKERLASPKPRKPRTCLRWSPTGSMFDLKGKIITSSESECQSDSSQGDNACTSNHKEPTIKRFPNSTFSLACSSNLFKVRRLEMLKAYDRKFEASHKFRLEVSKNGSLWK
ncbi:integrase, catalytic region, zinc finger, CCHC-type containing protein [Tanacetum coccineum]